VTVTASGDILGSLLGPKIRPTLLPEGGRDAAHDG
jgi:hypothetical protein